jgi:protein tyrosine phosphatase (PTP) superfamily phosphohydrolase (DUF442 family)
MHFSHSRRRWLFFLVAMGWVGAVNGDSSPIGKAQRIEAPGLHNVFRVSDKLYSGSSPDGDEGFRSLQKLGVQTILSVDGAKPEVDRAAKFGMRYVHIPIGYDAVRPQDALRMAKAVRDLPGPVYLHCHHGKHRGPAAAGAVLLCLDERCQVADAIALMKLAGTDPRYAGLYAAVQKTPRPTKEQLDAVPNDFPRVAKVGDLAERMVEVDATTDRLKEVQKAGWRPSPKHPDLDGPHEAVQLREHYQEALRLPSVAGRSIELRKLFEQSKMEADAFEMMLLDARSTGRIDAAKADAQFKKIADSCVRCHALFRDRLQP